jgi:hypothetical protein
LDVLGTSRIYQSGNTAASLMLNSNQGTIGTGYAFTLAQSNSAGNYNFTIAEGATTYLTLTNSISGAGGNLGLGVTPSAWITPAIQAGSYASVHTNLNLGAAEFMSNAYRSASTTYNYINTNYATRYRQYDGAHTWWTAASGTAGNAITFTQAMTLDADGDLGIGTSSPAYKLDISVAGTASYSSSSAPTPNIFLGTTGAANSRYTSIGINCRGASGQSQTNYITSVPEATDGNAALAFSVYGGYTVAERARIDSSGNLLIDTTSTSGAQGFAFVSSGASSVQRLIIGHKVGNTTGDTYHEFNYNSSQIGSITQVSTTGVLYNTTSDYRLKTVTGAVTGQGARLDALKPVDYLWTESGQQARGFLAHEFQAVYASSVNGTKDAVDENGNPKYQSMQAGSAEVIADLVAEIQSLRKRLADAGI